MIFDIASAATGFAVLLLVWLLPVVLVTTSRQLHGAEKLNWALAVTVLTWPGYALYLFHVGIRNRRP